ncbi:MAG: pyridoxamine 5'-phosphate oxidase [Bdellovibrionales bacterium]|nr:pyridoxamine 5'-phosphate oxidase [Bdellovibrionales bacterium]
MTKHVVASDDLAMQIGPDSNPIAIFDEWMKEVHLLGLKEPNAMTLATSSPSGEIHARTVLCKSWSEDGLIFFTNYNSQKGHDLAANPYAAAVFFWDALSRQVKVDGTVEKTSRQVSEEYWRSRARESQLSQFVSQQSQPAPSREDLEKLRSEAEAKFHGQEIPCPAHWGGYLLRPKAIEFWLGRPGRLHDRHQFVKSTQHWTYRRLYP